MRVLLDTHAFLWFVTGNPRLSTAARQAIEAQSNQTVLSIASIWEMAIKTGAGKLRFYEPFDLLLLRELADSGFAILTISVDHALRVAQLPMHHRDPFDRMVIAQAMTEGIPIISADSVFDAYPVPRIW